MGIAVISSIFQAFDIAERQADWVTTKARVTQSRNIFLDDTKRCSFRYDYVANKQQFSNGRYSAEGNECAGTAKFKTSDIISIYYDPNNPASSVVERVSPSAWFVVGHSVFALLAISLSLYLISPIIEGLFPFCFRRTSHHAPNNSKPVIPIVRVERSSTQRQGMRAGDVEVTLPIDFHEGIFGTQRTVVFDRLELNSQKTATLGSKSIDVTVPAGVAQGTRLRVAGLGDAKLEGSVGDLYIHLEMPYEYENLTREAGNILSALQLTAAQATQGGQFLITVVDGDAVMLAVPPGTAQNDQLKIKGRGVPVLGNPTVRGDHIVAIHIATETNSGVKFSRQA